MIDTIVEELPQVDDLLLYRRSSDPHVSTRRDFLARLPNLHVLRLGGPAISWDMLQHLGSNIGNIRIVKCPLPIPELATCFALFEPQSRLEIRLQGLQYDEGQRSVLRVSLHVKL